MWQTATSDPHIVLVAGLAATFAESVSMGAVAYTSTMADADFYESEREREYRHIQEMPHLEKDEIRAIYSQKGFKDDLLEHIVETITANPDIWVAVMMAEEHRLTPVDRTQAVKVSLVVGISAVVGSLISSDPVCAATSFHQHLGVDPGYSIGSLCCRYLQSTDNGWTSLEEWFGNGGDRYCQRVGWICHRSALESSTGSMSSHE
ncbi:MAG: VIT1/CCC1 transporter family protein [Anaerolineales bacterium]